MAFGFGFGQFGFGSRQGGGGGEPTAITPANADAFLASLGLTQAGTGTTWGETGQAATPLYEVAAGKVPLGYDTELGVFGPIVNPAGTNLALRDRDATQTAWVKTDCTAALATGDLIQDADWRGPQLTTGGEFLAGDGTGWSERPIGAGIAPIYAVGSVTLERVGGDQTQLYQDFATVVGRFYLLEVDLSGDVGFTVGGTDFTPVEVNARNRTTNQSIIFQATATTRRITLFDEGTAGTAVFTRVSVQEVSAHSLLTATGANGTCLQAITSSSAARVTKFWLARETGSGTVEITQDNGSTWAAVSLTSDPQPFNIAAATLANPTIGIRIVTSGDAVRLYRTQHQVASIPLRPSIGPTDGSTVTTGARTMICTLSESPSLVSLKLRFRTPTVNVAGQTVFSVDNNAATNLIDLKANGSGGFVLRKVIASSETAFSPFAVAVNTLVQVDVEISASVFRYRIDGGSWVNGTAGIPGSLSRFRTGHDNANAGQLGQPILALDELSTAAMMTGNRGWNKESLL